MLEVQLLGHQDVVLDGRSLLPDLGRRSVELVGYLALHAEAMHSRQNVASVFWPESTDAQALTNLRRELHLVRRALGADSSVLEVDSRTIRWSRRPSDTCDASIFLALAKEAESAKQNGGGDGDAFLRLAKEAAQHYTGPFMPSTYQEWAVEEREQLQRTCVLLLDELVRCMTPGDATAAIRYADRRVALEPLEEVGYQALMRLQSQLGDRAAALRTYHRCVSALDRELGVTPDKVTNTLYEKLASAAGSPSTSQVRARSAQLVGRSRDVDELVARWDKAAVGDAGLHVISGEAGMGKTRLIDEFAARLERSGVIVSWARCLPRHGQNALGPVAQWLNDPAIRARSGRLDFRWKAGVERLLAHRSAHLPIPPHSAMVDAWRQPEFFEGLARALVDPTKPTLLIIDDLHWCDGETAKWLPVLIDCAAGAPLLVLGAARSDELGGRATVADMTSQLRSTGRLTETVMTSLAVAETATLAEALIGARLTDEEKERWQQATGGLPLFIIEIARAGERTPGSIAEVGQLPRIQSVLERRLSQLSPAAQQVAALASCVGREFSLELLQRASNLAPDTVIDTVDELWRSRIVRALSAHSYDFTHELIRDAAYQRTDENERQSMHLQIAQAIEKMHSANLTPVSAALAAQYERAKVPKRAIHYHLKAASESATVFANVDAIRHYDSGLGMLPAITPVRQRDDTELTLRHAMSAPLNAEYGYASKRLRHELERAAELADRLHDDRKLLLSLAGLFAVRYVQGDVVAAYRISERSLVLRRRCPDVAGQAHFAYGGAATSLGMHQASLPHFAAAHALSIDQPASIVGTRPEVHGRAWNAHPLVLLGREDEALHWADWAIERAESAEHPYSLAVAFAYATITHQLRQDKERTAELAEKTKQLCERYHFAYYVEWGTILAGWCTGGHAGVDQIRQGLQALRAQGALVRQPYYLGLLADLLLAMGNREQAGAALDAALSAAADHDDRWWVPELLRLKSRTRRGAERTALLERARGAAERDGSVVLGERIAGG